MDDKAFLKNSTILMQPILSSRLNPLFISSNTSNLPCLDEMPVELFQYNLFSYLDSHSYCALISTCRHLKEVAQIAFNVAYTALNLYVSQNRGKIDESFFELTPNALSVLHSLIGYTYRQLDQSQIEMALLIRLCQSNLTTQASDRAGYHLLLSVISGNLKETKLALCHSDLKAIWINWALIEALKNWDLSMFKLLLEDLRINPFAFDHLIFKLLSPLNRAQIQIHEAELDLLNVNDEFQTPENFFDALEEKTNSFYTIQLQNTLTYHLEINAIYQIMSGLSIEKLRDFLHNCNHVLDSTLHWDSVYLISSTVLKIQSHGNFSRDRVENAILLLFKHIERNFMTLQDNQEQLKLVFRLLEELINGLNELNPFGFYTFYQAYAEKHLDYFRRATCFVIFYLKDQTTKETDPTFEFFLHLLKELILDDPLIFLNFGKKIQYYVIEESLWGEVLQKNAPLEARLNLLCKIFLHFSDIFIYKARDLRALLLKELLKDPRLNLTNDISHCLLQACRIGDINFIRPFLPYLSSHVSDHCDRFFQIALDERHLDVVIELFAFTPHRLQLLAQAFKKSTVSLEPLERDPSIYHDFFQLMLRATKRGLLDIVEAVFAIYPDVSFNEIFYNAVAYCQFEIAYFFLKQKGLNPSIYSNAALGWAAYYGQEEFFHTLLQDPRFQANSQSALAFQAAAKEGLASLLRLLLKDPHASFIALENPALKRIIDQGDEQAIKLFLKEAMNCHCYTQEQALNIHAAADYARQKGKLVFASYIQAKVDDLATVKYAKAHNYLAIAEVRNLHDD